MFITVLSIAQKMFQSHLMCWHRIFHLYNCF